MKRIRNHANEKCSAGQGKINLDNQRGRPGAAQPLRGNVQDDGRSGSDGNPCHDPKRKPADSPLQGVGRGRGCKDTKATWLLMGIKFREYRKTEYDIDDREAFTRGWDAALQTAQDLGLMKKKP